MPRKVTPFYLIIGDHDRKLFNVIGPMTNDTHLTSEVYKAQQTGRNIYCTSAKGTTKEAAIEKYQSQFGYTYTEALLTDTPSYTHPYKGHLPQYAQNADPNRIVRLMCKGKCGGETRYAEMTVDYPGEENLQGTQLGDFVAHCLMCGDEADDPYNWFR